MRLALIAAIAIGPLLAGRSFSSSSDVSLRQDTTRATPDSLADSVEAHLRGLRDSSRIGSRVIHLCPMPVARVDTAQTERMPVARPDISTVVPMPTHRIRCVNPLFRR